MFIQNPETWVGYLKRERAQADWEHYVETRILDATTKAAAKAAAKATAEGKAETAINLLSMNVDKNTIAQATGLSLEEIKKLENHGVKAKK